jgi:hypothetical protein
MDLLPLEILAKIISHARPTIQIWLVSKRWLDAYLKYVNSPWNYGLIHACGHGYIDYYVKWSKIAGVRWNPNSSCGSALRDAVYGNHIKVVKLLLSNPRINLDNTSALCNACDAGYVDMVKLLLEDPRIDPSINDSLALCNAIDNKHINIIELMLKYSKTNDRIYLPQHIKQRALVWKQYGISYEMATILGQFD